MNPGRPLVAVSAGDPAGIGPELCLMAALSPEVSRRCDLAVYADADVMERVAEKTGLPMLPVLGRAGDALAGGAARAGIVDCAAVKGRDVRPGVIDALHGKAAAAYIRAALGDVRRGRAAALVTAPISKEALHLAGIPFPGHTEMLAELTGARSVCMMMASGEIKVSLATVHVAHGAVPGLLSVEGIMDVVRLTAEALRRMGVAEPRLTMCGLNPHAGEGGLFGREEVDIIRPAAEQARREGLRVEGPLPPDTAFVPALRSRTDAYICMYHDQGLIPFKMIAFEEGVNITLGLPVVRTSPDHGTAFDIAWTGRASPSSFVQSILWACRLADAGGR